MHMSEGQSSSSFFSEVPQSLGEQSNRAVRRELSQLNAEVPKLQQELDVKRADLESQQKETDAALQEAQQLFDQALAEFQSVSNTITKIQTALESQEYRSVEKILKERERQQGFATEAERLQKLLADMDELKKSLEAKAENLQRDLQELVSASEQTLEKTIVGLSRAEKTRELGEKYESFTRQERELAERIRTLESRRQAHLETAAKAQSGEMSARVSSIVRLAMQSEALQKALLTPEQIASLSFATEEEIWTMLEGSLSPEQLREVSMEFKLFDKNIAQKIIELLQTENRQDEDLVQLDQEIQKLNTLKAIASEQAEIALGRLQHEFGVTDSLPSAPAEAPENPGEGEPVADAPAADTPELVVPTSGEDSNPPPALDTPDNSFDFLSELGRAGAASLDTESTDTTNPLPETSIPHAPETTTEDTSEFDWEKFVAELESNLPPENNDAQGRAAHAEGITPATEDPPADGSENAEPPERLELSFDTQPILPITVEAPTQRSRLDVLDAVRQAREEESKNRGFGKGFLQRFKSSLSLKKRWVNNEGTLKGEKKKKPAQAEWDKLPAPVLDNMQLNPEINADHWKYIQEHTTTEAFNEILLTLEEIKKFPEYNNRVISESELKDTLNEHNRWLRVKPSNFEKPLEIVTDQGFRLKLHANGAMSYSREYPQVARA